MSPVRVAVVQFEPRSGWRTSRRTRLAVEQRLTRRRRGGRGPDRAARAGDHRLRVRDPRGGVRPRRAGAGRADGASLRARSPPSTDVYIVGCVRRARRACRCTTPRCWSARTATSAATARRTCGTPRSCGSRPAIEGFQVFDTRIGRIGLLVCWDIWFPETARIVAQMGADIICIPTGWVWTPPPLYDASGVCMAALPDDDGGARRTTSSSPPPTGSVRSAAPGSWATH